jgi:hypothetical protein
MALAAMSWIFMGRLLAVKAGVLGGTASCSRVDESFLSNVNGANQRACPAAG